MKFFAPLADAMTTGLWCFDIILGAALFLIGAWLSNRRDEMETLRTRVNAARDEAQKFSSDLVSAKFDALRELIEQVQDRLKDGDQSMDGLSERNQKIELGTENKLTQVKDFVREHCASHADMRAHQTHVDERMARIEDRLATMNATMAVLSERTERTGGRKASQ